MTTEAAPIVIDTNVLISAGLLPLSKTAQVLQLALANFTLVQNAATWHELETRIAKPKFDRYFDATGRLRHLCKLAQVARQVPERSRVQISRDPSDDKFIALALDAGASLVISGDPDLKTLGRYQDIEILSPAEFFDRY